MLNFIIRIDFEGLIEKEDISLNINHKKISQTLKVNTYQDETIFLRHRGSDNNMCLSNLNGQKYFVYTSIFEEDRKIIRTKLKIKQGVIISDAELMMALYLQHGKNGFDIMANGFIFILLDYVKEKVFAFRDHIGIRNICYYMNGSSIYLSSSFKNLYDLKNKDFTLNITKIENFLNFNDSSTSNTFINEINKVPPSYLLQFHNNKIEISPYLRYKLKKNLIPPDAQVFELKELLKKSILIDKNGNYKKIGFLFSGGLDSSTIISFYRSFKKTKQDMFSFSAQYKNLSKDVLNLIDESEFQNEINKYDDVNDIFFNGEDESTLSNIDFYLEIVGQPFFFPNLYLSNKAFSLAYENDVSLVMNGNDGDTVVSHGYEYLFELFLSLRWFRLYKEILSTSRVRKQSKKFIFKQIILNQLSFGSFINKSAQKKHLKGITSSNHSKAIEVQSLLANYYGIEERYPFYNKEVIEYCLSVSPHLKNKDGYSRYILREAIKGIVPEKIRKRVKKANLAHALCLNFVNKDYKVIEDSLRKPNLVIKNIINTDELRNAWDNLKKNPRKYATRSTIPSKIFSFIVMNRWLDNFNKNN